MKLAPKPTFVRVFPLSVNNFKRNVFIRRPSVESQYCKLFVFGTGRQKILWCAVLIDQIGVENVELVSLDYFGRWVVHVVMSLVVFVPLKASVNSVEVSRFTRSVFVRPEVHLAVQCRFHGKLGFIFSHAFTCFALKEELFFCYDILLKKKMSLSK